MVIYIDIMCEWILKFKKNHRIYNVYLGCFVHIKLTWKLIKNQRLLLFEGVLFRSFHKLRNWPMWFTKTHIVKKLLESIPAWSLLSLLLEENNQLHCLLGHRTEKSYCHCHRKNKNKNHTHKSITWVLTLIEIVSKYKESKSVIFIYN